MKIIRKYGSYVFLLVAVALLSYTVFQQRDEFLTALRRLDYLSVTLAALVGLATLVTTVLGWRQCLLATVPKIPIRPVAQTVLISSLGKYVPGAIWPVVAQMEMMSRYGISRAQSALASIIAMSLSLGASIVLGSIGIFIYNGDIATFWWLFPIAIACFIILIPPVFRALIKIIGNSWHRFAVFKQVEIRTLPLLKSLGFFTIGGLISPLQTWLIIRALAPEAHPTFWLALAAVHLPQAVGFVIAIAPGGIGPREATLVALLSSVIAVPDALAVAIVVRAIQIFTDVVGALIGLTLRRAQTSPKIT